jgi:DNA-binding NarL/FixJ family response regulator
MEYSIAIIDDHSIILNGLKSILSNNNEFKKISIFTNYLELLNHLEVNQIDLLITDLSMPEKSGVDLIQEIRPLYPDLKIVVFTQYDDKFHFNTLLDLNINGYILKSEISSSLPEKITKILNGEFYITPEIANFLDESSKHIKLKPLEYDIIKLLIEGKTMKEMSEELKTSNKVIEYRLKKIRQLFSSKNNSELIYKMKSEFLKELTP